MSSIAYIGLNPGTKNTYVHSEHDVIVAQRHLADSQLETTGMA